MSASSDVKIVLLAQDQASKTIQLFGDKMQASLDKVSKYAAIAGAGLAAFAGKAIADFADAEAAQKQLEHATLAVAGGTNEQLKALEALSSELEKKGVLDGDAIKTGLAQLQTFGLSADMTKKLGGSLADLAVNQYGVNASSEQLTDSANMIAKALNGQFGVLEKSGIRFTDAQKQLIQYGSETEKAAALQEGFAQNLKYTNEVAAQTTEGGIAKLKVDMGNLSESIGGALAPALTKLVEQVKPVIEKMTEWAEKNPELLSKIILITGVVLGIIAVLGPLATAVGVVSTAFMFLAANPIVLVVAAIVGLVAAIAYLIANWETIGPKVEAVWNNIVTTIGNFIGQVGATLKGWADSVGQFFTLMWEGILAIFKAYTEPIVTEWNLIWTGLKDAFAVVAEAIKAPIQAVFDWIKAKLDALKKAAGAVGDVAKSIGGGVIGGIKSVVKKVTGKKALGGPVSADGTYMVGEDGPEMFKPYTGGTIVPNNRSMTMGNVNVAVNVANVASDVDVRTLANTVGNAILSRLRSNQLINV